MRTNREVRRSNRASTTRMPIETATSATDRVLISSSTKDDRKARRRVRIVSVRWARSVMRRPSSWARARPKTCRVGRPATRSAKWFDRRACWAKRRSTCRWVAMPMSAMKTGMSGIVAAIMSAERRSWVRMATPVTSGTLTAIMSCGRYFE